MDPSRIRNFCIIAHIDHGKSTLADRFLETTGTIARARYGRAGARHDGPRAREGRHDQGEGRAHGATRADDGVEYELNLIDTPGHVDFAYEVSRALAACEGALLVVDAAQGIQAQTLANVYLALEARPRRSSRSSTRSTCRAPSPSASPQELVDIARLQPRRDALRLGQGRHRHARDPRGDRRRACRRRRATPTRRCAR